MLTLVGCGLHPYPPPPLAPPGARRRRRQASGDGEDEEEGKWSRSGQRQRAGEV